ncbi:tRNA (adenosine(37)-N6)-dimethylallyltransferase MiaA [Candidatus Microgenomates bacterium]|nr:tRNA (adenosine(37)-N6)-dimethylallyltransferase MiaA [Candidatus Microgenomates bacterium]
MDNKIIIIGGQTATGKTDLAIKIAKEFNGEIISADSRQVYIGMDIGTGKDVKNLEFTMYNVQNKNFQIGYYTADGIKIWLYDVVKPNYQFSVGEYQDLANRVIGDIISRDKIPIVAGGTGLYLRSLIDSLSDITIPPDEKLRKSLSQLKVSKLQKQLQGTDRHKFFRLNNSDRNNPRRLIRAIEISLWKKTNSKIIKKPVYDYCAIILVNKEKTLEEKISQRIQKRLREGMEKEVRFLQKKGYDFNSPALSATGYQEIKDYLERKIDKDEAIDRWLKQEFGYAKKQLVWFKKFLPSTKKIFWFDSQDHHSYTKIRNLLCHFLKKPLS